MHPSSYDLAVAYNIGPGQCNECGRVPVVGLKWTVHQIEPSRKRPLENAVWECVCGHMQNWNRARLLEKVKRVQRSSFVDLFGVLA